MKPSQSWDEETLYTSGDRYFFDLILAIAQAKTSIELETYIYEKGVLADRITAGLLAAASRGVLVRMIIDGWGSPGFAYSYWPKLKAGGIRVRFFRVNPFIFARLPGEATSFWSRILARLRKTNRGNHRKFCLIDSTELWVGSFNISDVHLAEVQGDNVWKDIGVRVRGPELKYARRAFQRAYRGWTAFNLPSRSPRLLLLNDSYLHKRRARLEQVKRIRRAHSRVWLTTPYFVPVGIIFRALVRLAKVGVDVRIIVPEKNDVWFMRWLSLPVIEALFKRRVKVYIYSPRFSHQKVFITDDWICIGSTNLNHRSFLHDLEMDIVITHPENKKKIVESFQQDQNDSRVYDSREWTQLPYWRRALSSLTLLAKYWS